MSANFFPFLSTINQNIGNSLVSIATLIVLVRFLIEMCRGGFGLDKADYSVVLRDFVLLIIFINNFEFVYKLVADLPSLFKDIISPTSDDKFIDSVNKLFSDESTKKILWFDINASLLIGVRAFFLSFCSSLYNILTIFIMAFYSIGIFTRTMLGIKAFSNIMIGLVLFSSCYPFLFEVVDNIILQSFKKSISDDSGYLSASVLTLGSLVYTALPVLSFKIVMTKGIDLAKSIASKASAPLGMSTGLKLAGMAGRKTMKTGTMLGHSVDKRGYTYSSGENRNENFIREQKESNKKIKDLKKQYKSIGIDPTNAVNKEKQSFMDKWGSEYSKQSGISSGLHGYSKAIKYTSKRAVNSKFARKVVRKASKIDPKHEKNVKKHSGVQPNYSSNNVNVDISTKRDKALGQKVYKSRKAYENIKNTSATVTSIKTDLKTKDNKLQHKKSFQRDFTDQIPHNNFKEI